MSSCCSVDHWRNVFGSTERSIFEIIEMSIAVAAADRPEELVRRRDGIVKSLYTFPSAAAAARPEEEAEQQPQQPAVDLCRSSGGSQKSSMEEADELQDAIDDAFALLDEVLLLKKILDNKNEADESSLFESLRRLQLMELTVATLTETEIESSVRGLEGHGSSRVRQLARVLLDAWAELWIDSSNVSDAVADAPDTAANPSDDPWVNFPPLDEGALRAIISGPPIDLDELFSENPRKIRKFEGSADDRSKTPSRSAGPHNTLTERGSRTINASSKTPGKGKDLKGYLERCADQTTKKDDRQLANEPSAVVAKMTRQQCPTDESLVEAKVEASRMRIREGYDRANDGKKRRRIQLLDLHDIPKPVSSTKSCKSMARRDHRRRGFTNRWWRR